MEKKANDFQRGERQKEVSQKYRDGWEKIFGKQKKLKEALKAQSKS